MIAEDGTATYLQDIAAAHILQYPEVYGLSSTVYQHTSKRLGNIMACVVRIIIGG